MFLFYLLSSSLESLEDDRFAQKVLSISDFPMDMWCLDSISRKDNRIAFVVGHFWRTTSVDLEVAKSPDGYSITNVTSDTSIVF